MKKLIVALFAVLMMTLSVVPAFAKTVNSPVARPQAETKSVNVVLVPDKGDTSPKTGSDDTLAYVLIAASVLGCGIASAALVKMSKKN